MRLLLGVPLLLLLNELSFYPVFLLLKCYYDAALESLEPSSSSSPMLTTFVPLLLSAWPLGWSGYRLLDLHSGSLISLRVQG